ncbi:hypothetical protein RHOSPDRAFT_35493 [Rhodotorula sp. JG-1b]|nr:hypothetical protein RHOSPDRAFT_35493 [Rhodotorula sp. JG-1b]
MDAGTSTSPLLRLPDELLLAVFDLVAQDQDEDKDGMLAFLGRPRMPPSAYLVISKRLNHILTPRCRNEYTYDSDDESLSLAKVGESLAALFKKLPHLVDFAIDVETDSGVQMPGLNLGPCLLDGQIRQLEVTGSVFELPHLRNVKVQHLSLRLYGEGFYGEVSRPMLPLSELETLSFTGFVGVDLQANLHPFFDQYETYTRETGACPRLRLLKVYDSDSPHYLSAQTSLPDLVAVLNRLSSTKIAELDLTLSVKLDMSVGTITPLRNVMILRLHFPISAPETADTVPIAELIRRFPSLTRLSLRLRPADYKNDDPPPIWTTTRFCGTFPGIPTLVRDLSDTTEITRFVFERPQGPFIWTRDNASQELESRQICDSMAAGTSTSPLLRLPDELLETIFDLVVQHAQRDGPFSDISCLVVSKRWNRLMTPRWFRSVKYKHMEGDCVYSRMLSRPWIHTVVQDLDIHFPRETVHTWVWTLSHFTALRRLAIRVYDFRTEEDEGRLDDSSFTLARVGNSLAALFNNLPNLVDFSIHTYTQTEIDIPDLDLGPCFASRQLRRCEAPAAAFVLPSLRNVKVQHLALNGDIAAASIPFSELETLVLTTGDIDLKTLTPFLDQYATYTRQTGSCPRLRLLKVHDEDATGSYASPSTHLTDLVTFLDQLSSTGIRELDLSLRVKLAPSVRNITPLRNVETLRLKLSALVPETSDTVLLGELIQRFPSLTRLSLEIRTFGYERAVDLVRGLSWNASKLRTRFPGIPPLIDTLSRTTRILRLVLDGDGAEDAFERGGGGMAAEEGSD